MSRSIYCEKCKTPLGTIRDARLKKGLIYLCIKCWSKRQLDRNYDKLNKLFGGIYD